MERLNTLLAGSYIALWLLGVLLLTIVVCIVLYGRR
jgi:hypothetical protein